LFRNRTEPGEADAETGQPACAVAHRLPVRLPTRVAVLLEQVEDLGPGHGMSLLSKVIESRMASSAKFSSNRRHQFVATKLLPVAERPSRKTKRSVILSGVT
jgi:hypothetical protein